MLLPKLGKLRKSYPDIKIEITLDYGLTDIVAERYDVGVRSGEQVAKDMIAVRIGPDLRFRASPLYPQERPMSGHRSTSPVGQGTKPLAR